MRHDEDIRIADTKKTVEGAGDRGGDSDLEPDCARILMDGAAEN